MTDWLLFQLYGPLSAWGEIAVGESRVSGTHPGRSALIGMLAAALGIRRDDEVAQEQIARDYRFAVVVHSRGTFLRDYHTAQVPSQAALKKYPARTRRDELSVPKDSLGTILSTRDYRCDAYYQVAVEAQGESGWSLKKLRDALLHPVFPLYLGRKSCPVSLPLEPQIVRADSVIQALLESRFTVPDAFLAALNKGARLVIEDNEPVSLYWDSGMEAGIEPAQTFTRRDQPRTRQRWQFDERLEHHASLPRGD